MIFVQLERKTSNFSSVGLKSLVCVNIQVREMRAGTAKYMGNNEWIGWMRCKEFFVKEKKQIFVFFMTARKNRHGFQIEKYSTVGKT